MGRSDSRWRIASFSIGSAFLAACVSLLLGFLAKPASAALPFTIDIVDQGTPVAACPCVALDPSGVPHVTFQSILDRDLVYAVSNEVSWEAERVDTTGDRGYCSALALDSAGNPHIAYWDRTLDRLRYAWKAGGLWNFEVIDSGWSGLYVALQVDAQDRAHVTYALPLSFWYSERTPGGWSRSLIDGIQGYQSDLEIEPSGRVHILYQDAINGNLHYALKDGSQWTYELVDSQDVVGDACTLARDASGTLHAAYFDRTDARVRYATRNGSEWSVEKTGLEGGAPFVAIDPSGSAHITFYRNGHIEYASREGGSWGAEVVDASNYSGPASALAYDQYGNPHIVYEHQDDRRLRFADTALHLHSPMGGERWTAGDVQRIHWRGAGEIAVQLSSNGGMSFPVRYQVHSDTLLEIEVPRWPTNQARCRIERLSPYSVSESQDFSIEADAGSRFGLMRPYPNPWRGVGPATFTLDVPSSATVTLELIDVRGRVVSRRAGESFAGGQLYPVLWDPGLLPSRVYLVRAKSSSGQEASAKWVLLR